MKEITPEQQKANQERERREQNERILRGLRRSKKSQ